MTLWEFSVAADGWAESKGAKKKGKPVSADEYDRLVEIGELFNAEAVGGAGK